MLALYTFGDSTLDCGWYNAAGLTPVQSPVRNDNRRFAEFRGADLCTRGPARLVHCAVGGATAAAFPAQARRLAPIGEAVAIVTVGGNDLLGGLLVDPGPGHRGLRRGAQRLRPDSPHPSGAHR